MNRFRFDDRFIKYKDIVIDIRNVPSEYHQLITEDVPHAFYNFNDVVHWKYADGVIYVNFDYGNILSDSDAQAYVQIHIDKVSHDKNYVYMFINTTDEVERKCILVDDVLKFHKDRWDGEERAKIDEAEGLKQPDPFFTKCIQRDDTWKSLVYDHAYYEKLSERWDSIKRVHLGFCNK